MSNIPDYGLLVSLRRELHRFPELSGNEEMTSARITRFLEELSPDEIIADIGGKGLAARFAGLEDGPRVMVRAELDALPVHEESDLEYRSVIPGVSHKCGHDGHMAIAAGVAGHFAGKRQERGELIVLYQPSEENGKGALEVINDPRFDKLKPDYILALHNLPGFGLNEVVLRNGVFSMASVGMIIELKGKTSHAAEPENGISPAKAVSQIMSELPSIEGSEEFRHFTLATIIHARVGEIAFGTSPGEAVVMATLRASDDLEMEKLAARAEMLAAKIAGSEGLDIKVEWTERFPATHNDEFLNRMVGNIAGKRGYKVNYISNAFRWSEDFGWFTREGYRGLLFGLGAGTGHPELHSPDYDFPDGIIDPGVSLITSVCRELFKL